MIRLTRDWSSISQFVSFAIGVAATTPSIGPIAGRTTTPLTVGVETPLVASTLDAPVDKVTLQSPITGEMKYYYSASCMSIIFTL